MWCRNGKVLSEILMQLTGLPKCKLAAPWEVKGRTYEIVARIINRFHSVHGRLVLLFLFQLEGSMSQHISATARCAYTPHFPIQLIYSGYNSWMSFHLEKLLSFELLDLQRLALDCVSYAMLVTPNMADAAVHGWLTDTVIHMRSVMVTPWCWCYMCPPWFWPFFNFISTQVST